MNDLKKEVYIYTINEAIGDEKLTHFAQRAGISAGNLSRIRKGQVATPEILRKIATASGKVSYDELMRAAGFVSDRLADGGSKTARNMIVRIPIVYELDRSKKELLEDESLEHDDYFACTFPKGNFIYFVAKDDAIVPEGSRVLIDVEKTPGNNDTVLFLLDGKIPMLRRVTKIDRSYFYYGNDKNKYPLTPVKKSHMTIYGVAVEAKIFF